MVFITHSHWDHYGGLTSLIKHKIKIDKVYFNITSEQKCESEEGCDPKYLKKIRQKLKKEKIPLLAVESGMEFEFDSETKLEVLYAYTQKNSPIGKLSINAESVVILLTHKGFRFLLTGDLDHKMGSYLAKNGKNLKADILKIPHHAAAVLPPPEFFEMVNPHIALVPAPKKLWCSERSRQVRSWVTEKKLPTYVNGFHGHVQVKVKDGELVVLPSRDYPSYRLCDNYLKQNS